MNFTVVKNKLEKAGWTKINLKDDFEYFLKLQIVNSKVLEEKRNKLENMTFEQVLDCVEQYCFEESKKPIVKEYKRVHLNKECRRIDFLTNNEIENKSNFNCFALPSDNNIDLTKYENCGFIKNVIFLKIENGKVVDYFIHYVASSSTEQKRTISAFVKNTLKLSHPINK